MKNCIRCGKQYVGCRKTQRFCSKKCSTNYLYETGKLDGKKLTEAAHAMLREKGHYKRDNSYLHNPNHVSLGARERLSLARTGAGNPMWGKKPWSKMFPTKKWWEEKEFMALRKLALVRDHRACIKCGETKKDLYCDHIVPYRVCKEHRLENLQMLCGSCHSKKTARDIQNYPELRAQLVVA